MSNHPKDAIQSMVESPSPSSTSGHIRSSDSTNQLRHAISTHSVLFWLGDFIPDLLDWGRRIGSFLSQFQKQSFSLFVEASHENVRSGQVVLRQRVPGVEIQRFFEHLHSILIFFQFYVTLRKNEGTFMWVHRNFGSQEQWFFRSAFGCQNKSKRNIIISLLAILRWHSTITPLGFILIRDFK